LASSHITRAAARAAREKEKEEREKKREGKKKERQKEEGRNPTLGFFFEFLRFFKNLAHNLRPGF